MSLKKLSEKEAIKIILSILKKADNPLSTRDIEGETRKLLITCPDNTPVFLNKLRLKRIIKGQLSPERRGWIWWIEKES
jgi:hypothetical protein